MSRAILLTPGQQEHKEPSMSVRVSSNISYRVAAIQYEPVLGEKEKNVCDLLALVEDAIQHNARLIVLPELATTGHCWVSREEIAPHTETIPGPTTERFQYLASRYNCFIAIGLPEVDPTTQVYYDSVALLGPDGLVGSYRKLHTSINELRWARDGDLGIPVWETALGHLSPLICMDAMYFETARIAALRGADVLLFPTNWVDGRSPSSWWMARAFENGVYVIAANRYGQERGVQFSGGSSILNPDGSIQSYLDRGNGVVYGEVNLERCREKRWGPGHTLVGNPLRDRQPAVYTSLVNNSYLWEPLRYHSLYALGELPPGQLSCVGIVQMAMQALPERHHEGCIRMLHQTLKTMVSDNAPALPDVLVLPELCLPGPLPWQTTRNTDEEIVAHFRQGAIQIPGPETEALVSLANDLQMSMVIGVAERADDVYYSTVLLLDPEGIYGTYRKIHLSVRDRLWATHGNQGFPIFDTPAGRIGLATGYDVLFPETLRVLANKGADLVCAPALLDFPDPIGLAPAKEPLVATQFLEEEYNPLHSLIWRVRAAEHNVYLAVANWYGEQAFVRANGSSGIFSPSQAAYPYAEVVADEGELGLMMMTIDTREQRTGRRTSRVLTYSPGDMAGSLTGELAYNVLDSVPGNVVRSKPMLRKRQPFWYLDLVRTTL